MFYEELYEELGKLFYSIAAVDGRVATAEEMALKEAISNNWVPLEDSTDAFGTDRSAIINFAFDYEDAEGKGAPSTESFYKFFRMNQEKFTPVIVDNILKTAKAIADAFRKTNVKELQMLQNLESLLLEKRDTQDRRS